MQRQNVTSHKVPMKVRSAPPAGKPPVAKGKPKERTASSATKTIRGGGSVKENTTQHKTVDIIPNEQKSPIDETKVSTAQEHKSPEVPPMNARIEKAVEKEVSKAVRELIERLSKKNLQRVRSLDDKRPRSASMSTTGQNSAYHERMIKELCKRNSEIKLEEILSRVFKDAVIVDTPAELSSSSDVQIHQKKITPNVTKTAGPIKASSYPVSKISPNTKTNETTKDAELAKAGKSTTTGTGKTLQAKRTTVGTPSRSPVNAKKVATSTTKKVGSTPTSVTITRNAPPAKSTATTRNKTPLSKHTNPQK